MKAAALHCLALFIGAGLTSGQTVTSENGNVHFTAADGTSKQVTATGHDSAPLLSPDYKSIVFVRAVTGEPIATGSDRVEPTELWQVSVIGKEAKKLLGCRRSGEPKQVVAAFHDLQFSTDGKTVFFVTPAWATSGAVHAIDRATGKERFVCAGDNLEVIRSGDYRDCLLLQQHRYFVGGSSYDWFWVFRPNGVEVGPVGEDPKDFKDSQTPNE